MIPLFNRPFTSCLRWLCVVLALTIVSGTSAGLAQEADPVSPVGEAAAVGPWQMTVTEVLTGGDAMAAAAGASAANPEPADGLQYVAARVSVQNTSSQPVVITQEDFAVIGPSGLIRRSAGITAPTPELDGVVPPGESHDGWILTSADADADNLVLLYDSVTITGTWADHAFAITAGASRATPGERILEVDQDGQDPGNPIGIGRVASTEEWTVQIASVVEGAAVIDISPVETQRLGQSYRSGDGTYASCLDTWVAVQIEVANNGDDGMSRFLSPTAFTLAEADGSAVVDVRTLTPPAPDLSGEYAAGATRTGWVAFELPSLCDASGSNLTYDANLLRFQPFATSDDVRYLTWVGGQGPEPADTPTPQPFDPEAALPEGSTAVTTDEGVRMREEPSVDGEVIDELDAGVELEITGPPEEGDGFYWYPVRNPETDDEGWIVQDFLVEP